MTTNRKRQPLPAYAERLWTRLQANFLDTYKTLMEILETEAWKPTYDTFTEAYEDKMHSITFAPEMLPHIVYQMFDEGRTVDDVADVVKGVGPAKAKGLKEEKDSGVPPARATGKPIAVRGHGRNHPGPWKWLRLRVNNKTHREWQRKAKQHSKTVEAIAMSAIIEAFEKL